MARYTSKEEKIGKKYPFKRQFKDLWFYAEGQRKKIVFYFILTIIISLVAMAPPYLYGKIIDDLTTGKFQYIFLFLGLIALSHIVYQSLHNFIVYKTKIISAIIKNQASLKTFNHLFKLDYDFYETNPLGQILSRIQSGSRGVREFVKILFNKTLIQFFGMIFSIIILFTINWIVGIAALFSVGIYLLHGLYTTNRMIELENKVHHVSERVYARVFDFFSHIQIVKLLNIKDKLLRTLDKSYVGVVDAQKVSRRYERQKIAIEKLILDLSSVAILTYIALEVMGGTMTIGTAVMVFGFFTKFTGYTKSLWGDYNVLIEKRTSMYRMSLIYDNLPKIKEPLHPKKPGNWKEILFENVGFKYPSKDYDVLKDVNITVMRGEKVAIVGLSGSGKSTLAKLLVRLYLPKQGDINIGDVSVRDIHSEDLYKMIKIVPQENELINASIYENLQLATNKNVKKQEMIDSLKSSAAFEFVNKLPKKLKTVVGPEGVKISGGEKQRLCIARALLSKPQILVLDEATSNLDVITEKKVHEALHDLSKDITLIAITHRISSVYLFDRIIVMHEGRVVGEGTHKQLLKNNKYYQKLQEANKKERFH
jgi:ABC-type bacteriocin/lantibiotic exporter with double-glycine peptidase domain